MESLAEIGRVVGEWQEMVGVGLAVLAAWAMDVGRERRNFRQARETAATELRACREDLVASVARNFENNQAAVGQLRETRDLRQWFVYVGLYSSAAWAAHGSVFMRLCPDWQERRHFAEFFENIDRVRRLEETHRFLLASPPIEVTAMWTTRHGVPRRDFESALLAINEHGNWILARYGSFEDQKRLGVTPAPRPAAGGAGRPQPRAIEVAVRP